MKPGALIELIVVERNTEDQSESSLISDERFCLSGT